MQQILFFLIVSMGVVLKVSVAAELTVSGAISNAVAKTYLPAVEQFKSAAQEFQSVVADCDLAPAERSVMQESFSTLASRFSSLEFLRLGPLLDDNRLNRLFFWPDTRRVGERQMRKLLAEESVLLIDSQSLASKSVALQGLPAVERLLYSTATVTTDNERACKLLIALSDHINGIATVIKHDWAGSGHGFEQQLREPFADDGRFRSQSEVIRALVTQITTALITIANRKLDPMLVNKPSVNRKMAFWRSDGIVANLAANVESLRSLTIDSGLAKLAKLENELQFEFSSASGLLQKLEKLAPIADKSDTLNDEAVELLRALKSILSGIEVTVGERMSSALGVTQGFNSADGD